MGCVLHSNVGLLHGMMGLFNAWCDRVPMMVLGATGPVDAEKRRPWIDWIHTSRDQAAFIRPIIKWDDQPTSPQALVESMTRANLATRSAPTAPVYISASTPASRNRASTRSPNGPTSRASSRRRRRDPPGTPLAEAVAFVARAERPLIMFRARLRATRGSGSRASRSPSAWAPAW